MSEPFKGASDGRENTTSGAAPTQEQDCCIWLCYVCMLLELTTGLGYCRFRLIHCGNGALPGRYVDIILARWQVLCQCAPA
jgi:hypothetical protein